MIKSSFFLLFFLKEQELQLEIEKLEKLAANSDGVGGGFQHKQRLFNILSKQIEQKEISINEKRTEIEDFKALFEKANEQLLIVGSFNFKLCF